METSSLVTNRTPVDANGRDAIRGYLELVRPANLVTAGADILAGSAVAGAWNGHTLALIPASMLLYAGGVVFNDYFDRGLDAVERPERAIPGGRVPAGRAALFGATLLAAGIAAAFTISAVSGWVACAIAAAALLYDYSAKKKPLAGPLNMGACRGLNLLLGMTAAGAARPDLLWAALIPAVYIAAVTSMAAGEVHGGSRASVWRTLAAVAAVMAAVPALAARSTGLQALWALPFLAILGYRVVPPLWRALESPVCSRIFAAVKAGVLSLIVLDAAIAGAHLGVFHGLAVLALMVFAGALARLFAVT